MFQCEKCPKSYQYLQSLRRHKRLEHENCICKKIFSESLKTVHGPLELFHCPLCTYKTPHQKKLKSHINHCPVIKKGTIRVFGAKSEIHQAFLLKEKKKRFLESVIERLHRIKSK